MASSALKFVSVEEYLQMENSSPVKDEYLDGGVVAMAGATRVHNQIVSNLLREVGSFLKGKNCEIYPSDLRVTTPSGATCFIPLPPWYVVMRR